MVFFNGFFSQKNPFSYSLIGNITDCKEDLIDKKMDLTKFKKNSKGLYVKINKPKEKPTKTNFYFYWLLSKYKVHKGYSQEVMTLIRKRKKGIYNLMPNVTLVIK